MIDNEQSQLETLITQYRKLCQYCDDVFATMQEAFGTHIHCAKGCAACCTLERVSPLEAYMIASFLQDSQISPIPELSDRAISPQEQCVFLHCNECTIYPVRPIICRTHGIPIVYPDQQGIDACPLNFTDFDFATIDPQFLLDAETLTTNLMRLNLAFCILTQQQESAGDRIPLHSLIIGEYCIGKKVLMNVSLRGA
jgi:hypothetical protein